MEVYFTGTIERIIFENVSNFYSYSPPRYRGYQC